jgi:hypothetical protein
MGWTTIKGRRYSYRSERDGGRVKTIYFGDGDSGDTIANFLALDRLGKSAERDQRHQSRD